MEWLAHVAAAYDRPERRTRENERQGDKVGQCPREHHDEREVRNVLDPEKGQAGGWSCLVMGGHWPGAGSTSAFILWLLNLRRAYTRLLLGGAAGPRTARASVSHRGRWSIRTGM